MTNLDKLIAALENLKTAKDPEVGFNMLRWHCDLTADDEYVFDNSHIHDNSGRNCGTVACIAGWADMLITPEERGKMSEYMRSAIHRRTREWLGLTYLQANALFYGQGYEGGPISGINLNEALNVLYHLRNTGEVDWSKAGG